MTRRHAVPRRGPARTLAWLAAAPLFCATTLLATGGVPAPAVAQGENESDVRARLRYEAGTNLYRAGDFAGAAREYEAAYELSGRPNLLYNLYVAWRDAGELRKAADALERYLDAVPDAEDRLNLEARLASMQQQIATLDAAEAQRAAEAEAEQAAQAEAEAEAEAAPGGGGGGGPGPVPWIVGGVGAAAVVAGAITGVMALSLESDLEGACPGNVCPADRQDDVDRLGTLATTTDVLLFGGAALLATGVVLYFVLPRNDGAAAGEDDAALAPFGGCGPTGCLAGVRGRFQ